MIDVHIDPAQAQALIAAHDRIAAWCSLRFPVLALERGLCLLLSGELSVSCTCANFCCHRAARLIQCEDARAAACVADDDLLGPLHREAIDQAGAAVEQTIQLIERVTRTLLRQRRASVQPAWDIPTLAA